MRQSGFSFYETFSLVAIIYYVHHTEQNNETKPKEQKHAESEGACELVCGQKVACKLPQSFGTVRHQQMSGQSPLACVRVYVVEWPRTFAHI